MVLADPVSQPGLYFLYLLQYPLHLEVLVVPQHRMGQSVPTGQLVRLDPAILDFRENQMHLEVLDFLAYQAVHFALDHLEIQLVLLNLAALGLLVLHCFPDSLEDQDFLEIQRFRRVQSPLQVRVVQGYRQILVFLGLQLGQAVLQFLENHYSLEHHLVQVHLSNLENLGFQKSLAFRYHPSLQLLLVDLVYLGCQEFQSVLEVLTILADLAFLMNLCYPEVLAAQERQRVLQAPQSQGFLALR